MLLTSKKFSFLWVFMLVSIITAVFINSGCTSLTKPENLIEQGITYYYEGDYKRAIACYNKAIEFDPTYAVAYYDRGLAYAEKGDHDSAISDYNKAIRLDPRYAGAYHNRGIVYADLGNYNGAISDYSKAIKLNSKDAMTYYNRGNAQYVKGLYDKAIADYNKAINLNARYPEAINKRILDLKSYHLRDLCPTVSCITACSYRSFCLRHTKRTYWKK